MKIILTQEVPGLGIPGDVVTVKDGYGRNYLMPRGFAVAWTRGGQKQVDQIKRARKVREVRGRDHAEEIRKELESLVVTLPARAGDAGRLFGSITNADVADAVKKAGGPLLDKRKVSLSTHVKTLGKYSATVQIHPEVSATVTLDVIASD